jgi:transposase
MSGTTGRLANPIRQRLASSTRATAAASVRNVIWRPPRRADAGPHAYAGFSRLYEAGRKGGSIIGLLVARAPQVLRAGVAQAGTDRHRGGEAHRCPVRHRAGDQRRFSGASPSRAQEERSRPLVAALQAYLQEERIKLSGKSETARALDYSLKRWPALTRFLDDGRLCLSGNAAERALRGIAVGRHNWTFAGSDERVATRLISSPRSHPAMPPS